MCDKRFKNKKQFEDYYSMAHEKLGKNSKIKRMAKNKR